jgi:hypothetical protein
LSADGIRTYLAGEVDLQSRTDGDKIVVFSYDTGSINPVGGAEIKLDIFLGMFKAKSIRNSLNLATWYTL